MYFQLKKQEVTDLPLQSPLFCYHYVVAIVGSAMSCKPYLFHHKLPIWPPCGTVLTGGVQDDFSHIPAWNCQMNVVCFIWLQLIPVLIMNLRCYWSWRFCLESTGLQLQCYVLVCEESMVSAPSFSHRILIVMVWLAEATEQLAARNPVFYTPQAIWPSLIKKWTLHLQQAQWS